MVYDFIILLFQIGLFWASIIITQTEKENEGVEKKFFFLGAERRKQKKTPKTITATAAEATALQLQGYRVPLKN